MRAKRKRAQDPSSDAINTGKRQKTYADSNRGSYAPPIVQHPTLRLYYTHVCTLRSYLYLQLPARTSKARYRRLAAAGLEVRELPNARIEDGREDSTMQEQNKDGLASLLDTTLICANEDLTKKQLESTEEDFINFSQQSTLSPGSSLEKGTISQSDVGRPRS